MKETLKSPSPTPHALAQPDGPDAATAEVLTERLRAQVENRRNDLAGRRSIPGLTIIPPPEVPANLAGEIVTYNARVAALVAREQAADCRYIGLPGLTSGTAIIAAAAGCRADRWDLSQHRLALLTRRAALSLAVAAALEQTLPDLEAARDRAIKSTRSALEKAGLGLDPRIVAMNPDAAEHQLAARIRMAEPVRQAQAGIDQRQVDVAALREQASAAEQDADKVREQLVANWPALVGL